MGEKTRRRYAASFMPFARPMQPTHGGYFGEFGGRFVPEVLIDALESLERGDAGRICRSGVLARIRFGVARFRGPSIAVVSCGTIRRERRARTVPLKREDTNHTGAHKINNTVGQALLARRMGKKRLIAETGAGQHGVATATVGAKFGFPVDVYMGQVDVERQALNVYIMNLLGANVHAVSGGTKTLKDATNEAFRVWAATVEDTFYVIGSVVGAHPYPFHGSRTPESDRCRGARAVLGAIWPVTE